MTIVSATPMLRVIIDPPATGAWNMAVDEALLLSDYAGITLRFYEWQVATLSLGYFQSLADRERHNPSRNCPIVRRASGGGAIMHDQELTYSLVIPVSQRFGESATQVYDLAHESLIEALAHWNIRAVLHRADEPRPSETAPFLCFERRSPGDVLLGVHKICGSAQRRHRSRILQHGSVLFRRSSFAPELLGLCDLAASVPEMAEFRRLWQEILARRLQNEVVVTALSVGENAAARGIALGKFSNPSWNAKR